MAAASGEGPFGVDPVFPTAHGLRVVRRIAPVIGMVAAWALVGGIELVDIPNISLGVLIVPLVEAAIWTAAVGVTIYVARMVRRIGAILAVIAALIGGLAFGYFTNWSALEPRSYYEVHRWGFAEVADLVQRGELGTTGDDYYGQRLPRYLADLSTNGRAATVAFQDGKPVVFLAQYMGIPDDAIGFVYFDGVPDSDLLIDLFGYPATFADGEQLGDGWWYVR
jgi:hypothetical protein